jgi:hypothetical protein
MDNHEIKFTEKKVDDGWKEQVARDKQQGERTTSPRPKNDHARGPYEGSKETSKVFLNLLTSLSYQAMIHLGEIPHPETQAPETNLEAAREVIDLLVQLKNKTQGNLSPEEVSFFNNILADLQMKFSQKV